MYVRGLRLSSLSFTLQKHITTFRFLLAKTIFSQSKYNVFCHRKVRTLTGRINRGATFCLLNHIKWFLQSLFHQIIGDGIVGKTASLLAYALHLRPEGTEYALLIRLTSTTIGVAPLTILILSAKVFDILR